jgi:hypothetical protein
MAAPTAPTPPQAGAKQRKRWVQDTVILPSLPSEIASLMQKSVTKVLVIRERKSKEGKLVYRITVF